MAFPFTDRVVGQPYHPRVQLVDNAPGKYAMDVLSDRSTVATCGAGTGTDVTMWEQSMHAHSRLRVLGDVLASYDTTKGSVKFPPGAALPVEVVRALLDARLAELGFDATA